MHYFVLLSDAGTKPTQRAAETVSSVAQMIFVWTNASDVQFSSKAPS